jgi:hypothetical protein
VGRDVISRDAAYSAGLARFFTGDVCLHGHLAERYTVSGSCVECHSIRRREFRAKNRELVIAQRREYREANREKLRAQERARRAADPQSANRRTQAWRERNQEHLRAYDKARWAITKDEKLKTRAARLAADPFARLSASLRGLTRKAFQRNGYTKRSRTSELLGCTWEELRTHIEKQFLPRMSWENRDQWHVDHIVPLASAKSIEDLEALCHFTNLRPLWARTNQSKSGKRETLL